VFGLRRAGTTIDVSFDISVCALAMDGSGRTVAPAYDIA
jgi:hypothetical protein